MSELEWMMLASPEAAEAHMERRRALAAPRAAATAPAAAAAAAAAALADAPSVRSEEKDFKQGLMNAPPPGAASASSAGSGEGAAAAAARYYPPGSRSLRMGRPLTQAEMIGFQAETTASPDFRGLREKASGFEAGHVSLPRNLAAHAAAGVGSYLGYKREAAQLGLRTVREQPFVDGNHRTAVRSIYEYLYKNGLSVPRDPALVYGRLAVLWEQRQKDPNRPVGPDVEDLAKYLHQVKRIKSPEESGAYAQSMRAKIAGLPTKLKAMSELQKTLADPEHHIEAQGENTPERKAKIAALRRYLKAKKESGVAKEVDKATDQKKDG